MRDMLVHFIAHRKVVVLRRTKFQLKKAGSPTDYSVMPLEGLWWMEDLDQFSLERRDDWLWTLMIVQPPHVTASMVAEALAEVEIAKAAWLKAAKAEGKPIPRPRYRPVIYKAAA